VTSVGAIRLAGSSPHVCE